MGFSVSRPGSAWRRLKISSAVVGLTTLAACSPGANLPPLPGGPNFNYRLSAGEQVRIITVGETSLTGDFRISDSGNIAVPLLGSVHANGLSPTELGTEIARELRDKKLFKDPSVSVEVLEYRPFFVLGEVNHPGQYPYQPGMSVLTAVAVAGGFTYRAIDSYASIVRDIGDKAVEGKVTRSTLVEPGDTITVFERRF